MLKDIRLKKFNDSIIAILESNLHDGATFFNYYPNFSINLRNDKLAIINSVKPETNQELLHTCKFSSPTSFLYYFYRSCITGIRAIVF